MHEVIQHACNVDYRSFISRKCLSVFTRSLIEELAMLWTDGVATYDLHDSSSFQLRAAVLWTITDFPGLGVLAGYKIKGYRACLMCLDDIIREHVGDMTCYKGHRRWLPREQSWRKDAENLMVSYGS